MESANRLLIYYLESVIFLWPWCRNGYTYPPTDRQRDRRTDRQIPLPLHCCGNRAAVQEAEDLPAFQHREDLQIKHATINSAQEEKNHTRLLHLISAWRCSSARTSDSGGGFVSEIMVRLNERERLAYSCTNHTHKQILHLYSLTDVCTRLYSI